MAHSIDDLTATKPVGGLVMAAVCGLFAVAGAPFTAVELALSGQLADALLMLVLGVPLFGGLAYLSVGLNREVHEYRSLLRTNHPWLHALGVTARLGFWLLLAGVMVASLAFGERPVEPGAVVEEGILLLGVGLAYSAFSVAVSCIGLMTLPWLFRWDDRPDGHTDLPSLSRLRRSF